MQIYEFPQIRIHSHPTSLWGLWHRRLGPKRMSSLTFLRRDPQNWRFMPWDDGYEIPVSGSRICAALELSAGKTVEDGFLTKDQIAEYPQFARPY